MKNMKPFDRVLEGVLGVSLHQDHAREVHQDLETTRLFDFLPELQRFRVQALIGMPYKASSCSFRQTTCRLYVGSW